MSDYICLTPPEGTDYRLFISESAYHRLVHINTQQNQTSLLHIQIDPGGCSGYQYQLSLIPALQEGDFLFTYQDVSVSTDTVSMPLLQGLMIDYVEEMMGSSFIMKNPNATASCGCGNSFTVF